MFNRILIVCIGNICRSPMGEGLLRTWLNGKGVTVHSAGLGALIGHPAEPNAQELMAEQGVDISSHRARQLTPSMVMEYDLILVMETDQQKAIEAMQPSARGRIYRIGHWSDFDIPDPYRKPRSAFEQALSLINQGLQDWREKLWK